MKNKLKNNPFEELYLDTQEQQLETAFERGEYQEDPDFEETKSIMEEAASRYLELNTTKPVTIRINQLDLLRIKAKAKKKQIPYQTLLGAIIRDYVEDKRKIEL